MNRYHSIIIMTAMLLGNMNGLAEPRSTAHLEGLNRPESLNVMGDRFFVTQGPQILVYSLDSPRLVRRIGKPGSGPEEFIQSPLPIRSSLRLIPLQESLFINAIGKVAVTSLDGQFLWETKIPRPLARYKPIGRGYIGFAPVQEGGRSFVDIQLLDKDFKPLKNLHRFIHFFQAEGVDPIRGGIDYYDRMFVWMDMALIPGDDGLIHVFDSNGEKIRFFDPGIAPVPLSESLERKYDDFYSRDPRFKPLYLPDRGRVRYPDTLPAVRDIRFGHESMVIITFDRKNGLSRCVMVDKGFGITRTADLPIREESVHAFYPFDIVDGSLYQLVEEGEGYRLASTEWGGQG